MARKSLTLVTATEIAIGTEVTDEHLALIGDFSDSNKEIHKIDHKVYEKSVDKRCAVCGRNNHTTDNCRLKNASCYGCGKKGHIKTVCRMKPQGPSTSRHTNLVENEGTIEEEQQIYIMYTVTREGNGVLSSVINLNKQIKFQVDTGVAVSIILKDTWKKVWGKERPEIIPSNIQLRGFTGKQIRVTVRLT